MTDILISARRGSGAPAEILYGTVTFKPTMAHTRSTSIVLPAPSTFDLVNGEVVATNVQPTPLPNAENELEWAYEVIFKDRHSKTYSFLVGVPDSTTQVLFTSLPRYFETKPPLFGEGPQGIPGDSATIAVGTVTGGTIASVTNTGTGTDAVLDFVLPKGDKGDTGAGVPEGGTALQVIRKTSDNTSTEWATLDKSTLGLGNVDNTSDLAKPVSTAQATAIREATSLPYRSKLFSDTPTTYPEGTRTFLASTADGWPRLQGSDSNFTSVTNIKTPGYRQSIQFLMPYNANAVTSDDLIGNSIYYRMGSQSNVWGPLIPFDKDATTVTVTQFGAVGDGVTDDTEAIQATVTYASNLENANVVFPPGKYLISSSILLNSSNMKISGYGATMLGSVSPVFEIRGGGISDPADLVVVNRDRGANQLTLTKNTFEVGDILMLVSQRVATSLDTPPEDRLGGETGDGSADNGPYFGEFVHVAAKDSSNSSYDVLTLSTTLNYNGYRIDKTLDPSSDRNSAQAYKLNAVQNVSVEGFTINAIAGTSVGVYYGYNVTLRDIKDIKNHNYGVSILFANSYTCSAENVESQFTYPMPSGGLIYQRNVFKVIGSQGISWEGCTSELASQAFDVTYNRAAYLITSSFVDVEGCTTIGASSNPLTTHPGTSDINIKNNNFSRGSTVLDASGLGIRSPRTVIDGNKIAGQLRGQTSGLLGNYGISLFDGGGRECTIINNYIEGFDRGIFFGDGAVAERRFTTLNNLISNNRIKDCFASIATSRSTANTENPYWDILISGNRIDSIVEGAVGVWIDINNGGSRGYTVSDNSITLSSTSSSAVKLGTQSEYIVISANRLFVPQAGYPIQFVNSGAVVNHDMGLTITSNVSSEDARFLQLPIFSARTILNIFGNSFTMCFPLEDFNLNMYSGNYTLVAPTGASSSPGNNFPSTGGGNGIIESTTATNYMNHHRYFPMNSTGVAQFRYRTPGSGGAYTAWKTF